MKQPVWPSTPGAYRWLYADATAGEVSAVFIFMVGAVFSPRYVTKPGDPLQHCAVNAAVYRRGKRRAWAFTEYATMQADERSLRIGASTLRYEDDGRVAIHVTERTAPWGGRLEVALTLQPDCPPVDAVQLAPTEPHWWQVLAARAQVQLDVPSLGISAGGHGYHDTNWGDEPLGGALPGWTWSRQHAPERTEVALRPFGDAQEWRVEATNGSAHARRAPAPEEATTRTMWGLDVPARGASLLESSPFYARLEAGPWMGEVADFHRFRQPRNLWMAKFRMRKGSA